MVFVSGLTVKRRTRVTTAVVEPDVLVVLSAPGVIVPGTFAFSDPAGR